MTTIVYRLQYAGWWIGNALRVIACLIIAGFQGACAYGLFYVAQHYVPHNWPYLWWGVIGVAGLMALLAFVSFTRVLPTANHDESGRDSHFASPNELGDSGISF